MAADYLTPRSPRSAAPAWPGTSPDRTRCILVRAADGADGAGDPRLGKPDATLASDDVAEVSAWILAQREAQKGGAVAVITSEPVIQALVTAWVGGDASRAPRVRVDPGRIAVVDLDANGAALRALNVDAP